MSRPTTTHWHTTFIDTLHAGASVAQAARAAGVSARTAYRHHKQNAHFRAAWAEALGADPPESESANPPQSDSPTWPPANIVGALEREAWRRTSVLDGLGTERIVGDGINGYRRALVLLADRRDG